MLELKGITKTYRSKKGTAVKALKDVTLALPNHGLIFITGKSGCGKSTLLNVLGGLDAPDSGQLIVRGRSSRDFEPSDYDGYRNTFCGFVFQEYNLIEGKTVGGNVALALELQGKTAERDRIEEALKRVDLIDEETGESLIERYVNELSGGQKQRVTIARALIKDPEIILADEPTGALDSETSEQLYKTLKNLSKEKLIVVVSHDQESALKYGDRIIELKDGKVLTDSAPGLKENPGGENGQKPAVFIKSKLPFKRILAMGASGLKVKKFRLAMSVILSVLTFAIFAFSLTAAFANPLDAELGQMAVKGLKNAVVYNTTDIVDEQGGGVRTVNRKFTDEQIRELTAFNVGVKPPLAFNGGYYNTASCLNISMSRHLGIKDIYNFETYDNYASMSSQINGLIELNPDTGLNVAGLKPDDRLLDKSKNRLPQTYDEIALTDVHADAFMRYGYVEKREMGGSDPSQELEVIPIRTPDDLIGKKLGMKDKEGNQLGYPFTVVGIFSTEQNREEVKETFIGKDRESLYAQGLKSGLLRSLVTHGFVKEGFLDYAIENGKTDGNYVHNLQAAFLIRLSGNTARDAALIKRLNVTVDGVTYKADIATAMTGFSNQVEAYFYWVIRIGLVAVVIFSFFSVLLMMNFLNVSIDSKKREIGILRALGARKAEIAGICLVESFLIMAVELILASVITAVLCAVLNSAMFFLQVLRFGIVPICLLILLCTAVAALATLIPALKITNRKPIDIINNK